MLFRSVQGNATLVYRAEVDPANPTGNAVERYDDEERAYAALEEKNTARLRAAGVDTTV